MKNGAYKYLKGVKKDPDTYFINAAGAKFSLGKLDKFSRKCQIESRPFGIDQ